MFEKSKNIHIRNILLVLPDLNVWVQRLNRCLPFPRTVLDAKVLGPIDHDALGIKRCPPPTVAVIRLLPEVFLVSRFHIFHQNGNIGVAVRS